jgi:hypothetical protein
LNKTLPDNFGMWLHPVEDGRILDFLFSREAELQLRAALRAGMLCEKDNASLGALRCKPITVPGGQFNTRNIPGRDASQVEHNGAKAACLHQQVGTSYALLDHVVLPGSSRDAFRVGDRN